MAGNEDTLKDTEPFHATCDRLICCTGKMQRLLEFQRAPDRTPSRDTKLLAAPSECTPAVKLNYLEGY